MKFEQPPHRKPPAEERESYDRFVNRVKAFVEANFGEIRVSGREHLQEILPDRKVIIVTSHISDSDVPISIAALGHDFEIAVAHASTHLTFSENPAGYLGRKFGGETHFLPLRHSKKEGTERGVFRPEDFVVPQESLGEGKTVVLAAYYDPKVGWELPERGGYGAVYLAQRAGATLLPVAVDIKSRKPIKTIAEKLKSFLERPDVDVNIGSPFELPAIEHVERIAEILRKRKSERLTNDERTEFAHLADQLQEQSAVVMKALATLLPEEKRGPWREQAESSPEWKTEDPSAQSRTEDSKH